ncbi:MAG: hypothetical protein JWQ40_4360 [Segetibacter sp.]|jgi:hypothetical protein|nr:hypothetical protein [Segetibacter sp.]
MINTVQVAQVSDTTMYNSHSNAKSKKEFKTSDKVIPGFREVFLCR